ncbi:MAG: alpha-1,6-mannosyltransferase [Saprospiraceae bacterium]|jgi:alpha-1,6-mannosyltransferase
MKPGTAYKFGVCLLWFISILALCYLPKQYEFSQLALYGGIAFLSYFYILWKPDLVPVRWLVAIAIGVRILIIPSFPLLSDDIYRFIWDGRLWHLGINPYSHLPIHWTSEGIMSEGLFSLLNSPEYYTIYPPFAQGIFYLSTLISSTDFRAEAIIMKSIHCLFEIGALRVLWLLLKEYKLPAERWALYALNPLIIVEVLANVHHEGVMIFFTLLCLLLIAKNKYYIAGISMALAIATKLLPLLLCPLLFFYLKGKGRWQFTLATILVTLVLFGPILINEEMVSHLLDSADLYVRSFEFNASIYYFLNEIGQRIYGYNIIGTLGPCLKVLTIISIIYLALKARALQGPANLPSLLLGTYLVFVLFSSTVHPWYILLLIGLAPLTPFRFPIIWSFLILGTYINYSFNPYQEQIWMVVIEYIVVALVGIVECRKFIQKGKGLLPIFEK